jgi:hypothetical protein
MYAYSVHLQLNPLVTYDRSLVFSGYFGFFTNKTDRHDITEILLKVALSTITLIPLRWKDEHLYIDNEK